MNHYISTYDDILTPGYCRDLIERFEANPQCHHSVRNTDAKWQMRFTQINLYQHEIFRNDVAYLSGLFREAVERYKADNKIEPYQWPQEYTFEQIRMKRYQPGGDDRFDTHVDVTNHDSARRFLVVFFYLNDDFEGGETDFPQLQMMAKPKPGRLIMFPPMWAWWHRAKPIARGSPKYIVGTLLHYK